MPSILDLTDEEFHRRVCDAIHRELGLAGCARFLRTFRSGRGDYTADCHKWLSSLTSKTSSANSTHLNK